MNKTDSNIVRVMEKTVFVKPTQIVSLVYTVALMNQSQLTQVLRDASIKRRLKATAQETKNA